jgi:macrolide transport system ATP-binding/permease protein
MTDTMEKDGDSTVGPRNVAPAILLKNVIKRYAVGDSEIEVLHGVSLTIETGEFVAIIGPSGSGKTTLMNILGLMDTPTEGDFELQGRDVSHLTPDERAEARGRIFGFIFQRYNLLTTQTALENVELPGFYIGMPAEKRKERALMLLQSLGLGHRTGNRPSQLSGGEQQRVAVSRALMNGGSIILADEPTGALDTSRGKELMLKIHDLHRMGHTVILITHDPGVAAEAKRVIRIVDGSIISDEIQPDREMDALQEMADDHDGEKSPESVMGVHPSLGLPDPVLRKRIVLFAGFMEAVRMATHALQANLFRTFLTMLGVIIGVSSVVAMLAIGEGSQQSMMQAMSRMGTNMLRIEPGAKNSLTGGALSMQDVAAISNIDHVRQVIPRVWSTQILRNANKTYSCSVAAVSPNYAVAENRLVVMGNFFDQRDNDFCAPVVVLGMKSYLELFHKGENPVGKYILLNSAPFLVVGVVTVRGGHADGRDREDDVAYIPLATGEARIFRSPRLSQIGVQVDEFKNVDLVQDEIRSRLNRLRDEEDFRIFNQAALIEATRHAQDTFRFLLGSVASVALVVGGIGVMNIMLVNVVERTREIGVRMACGARSRDIQLQFLTEAILVCLLGGVIGIILGALLSSVLVVGDTKAVLTLPPIILSFSAAFITGVLFGYWPARKASQLDPVVALSSE